MTQGIVGKPTRAGEHGEADRDRGGLRALVERVPGSHQLKSIAIRQDIKALCS